MEASMMVESSIKHNRNEQVIIQCKFSKHKRNFKHAYCCLFINNKWGQIEGMNKCQRKLKGQSRMDIPAAHGTKTKGKKKKTQHKIKYIILL